MADLVAVFAIIAAAWLLLAAAAGFVARRRGRSGIAWPLIALVLSPAAIALLLLLPRRTAEPFVSDLSEPDDWADRIEPVFVEPEAFEEDRGRPPPIIAEPQDWAARIAPAILEPEVFEKDELPPAVAEPAPASYDHRLPRYVAFVDVETTGLGHGHRIVSFACILLSTAPLAWGRFDTHLAYCVFNPGRPCDPQASRVHGFTDRFLASQEGFSERADAYELLLSSAELVVAHNVEFDLGMIDRELALLGRPRVAAPRYCTMRRFQARAGNGSAKLDAVAAGIGLKRAGRNHGALEDAWLAMMIYLHQQSCPHRIVLSELGDAEPINIRVDAERRQPSRRRLEATA